MQRVAIGLLLLILAACARADLSGLEPSPDASGAIPTETVTPLPSLSVSATPTPSLAPWVSYTDAEYAFSVEYPATFTTELVPPRFAGELRLIRFFDRVYQGTYPEGQVEVVVVARDASSVKSWVESHSGNRVGTGQPIAFFRNAQKLVDSSVGTRSAITFEWDGEEAGLVHTIAFFHRSQVVYISWHAAPAYAVTLQPIFDHMVGSFEG